MRCTACQALVALDAPTPFACPEARAGDNIDHLLAPRERPPRERLGTAGQEASANPFVRYRGRLRCSHLAAAQGITDERLVALIEELDAAIAELDGGRGFLETPLVEVAALARAVGVGRLWIKNETVGVSGSHKARHLMGLMLHLRVAELAGLLPGPDNRRPLAIASCGNAALAAALVARAASWPLEVFIPPDAAPAVVRRLHELGASVHVVARDGQLGDPCYRAFQAALATGALPFCCQGPDNGLTIEGGQTLAYELSAQLRAAGVQALDRLFVQVGGGALASSVYRGLVEARALGELDTLPRLQLVQTRGAYPLARAYDRFVAALPPRAPEGAQDDADRRASWIRANVAGETLHKALAAAARARSHYMWPWESEPHSLAHGILDDETYDWRVCLEAMLHSGGYPLLVEEAELVRAHRYGRSHSAMVADHTGVAGLAGLLALAAQGGSLTGQSVVVLFSGKER